MAQHAGLPQYQINWYLFESCKYSVYIPYCIISKSQTIKSLSCNVQRQLQQDCDVLSQVVTQRDAASCCRVLPALLAPISWTMARKRPLLFQRRHYSRDLKERVIYQSYTLHKKPKDIAIDLDMSLRVVHRVRKLWKEIGEVVKDPKSQGRDRLLKAHEVEVCSCYISSVLS